MECPVRTVKHQQMISLWLLLLSLLLSLSLPPSMSLNERWSQLLGEPCTFKIQQMIRFKLFFVVVVGVGIVVIVVVTNVIIIVYVNDGDNASVLSNMSR